MLKNKKNKTTARKKKKKKNKRVGYEEEGGGARTSIMAISNLMFVSKCRVPCTDSGFRGE